MTPQAHRAPARRYPCPGCATCRRSARRERLIALAVTVVFVGYFLVPAVWRVVHG